MIYPSVIRSPYAPDVDIPVTLTDDIYWAAQPLPVQALRTPGNEDPVTLATALFEKGYLIDENIMIWGWDAVMTMILRITAGYTWGPNAFQSNIPISPGITNAWNLPPYDPNHPPAGSLKFSVSASDFPPVAKPVPTPSKPTNVVGVKMGSIYQVGPAAKDHQPPLTDGDKYTDLTGTSYTFHGGMGLMGFGGFFTQP